MEKAPSIPYWTTVVLAKEYVVGETRRERWLERGRPSYATKF